MDLGNKRRHWHAQCCIDNKLETLCEHLISTLLGILEGKEMPKKTVFSGEIVRRGTTRSLAPEQTKLS